MHLPGAMPSDPHIVQPFLVFDSQHLPHSGEFLLFTPYTLTVAHLAVLLPNHTSQSIIKHLPLSLYVCISTLTNLKGIFINSLRKVPVFLFCGQKNMCGLSEAQSHTVRDLGNTVRDLGPFYLQLAVCTTVLYY